MDRMNPPIRWTERAAVLGSVVVVLSFILSMWALAWMIA